jgi:hypothetical protein
MADTVNKVVLAYSGVGTSVIAFFDYVEPRRGIRTTHTMA